MRRLVLAAALCGAVWAQAPDARPKFEVASVKECGGAETATAGERHGDTTLSPGTLRLDCSDAIGLVRMAYVLFADGRVNPHARVEIVGEPSWMDTARYRIDAKSDGAQSGAMMHGPMLQRLLEERFGLRVHWETREVPAYAVTVAKGGPKLRTFREGSCVPVDWAILLHFPLLPLPELPAGHSYCGGVDADDAPAGPSIFTAMQEQLGLKLEAAKAPGKTLVIDRIERPSAN